MNSILQAISRHANDHPDQLAFIGHDVKGQASSLTYRQLKQQVDAAALSIVSLNVNAIALKAENCLDWVIADLAAMQARVVIIPIPTFFAAQQVEHSLEQSAADLLIGDWPEYAQLDLQIAGLAAYRRPVTQAVLPLKQTCKITFTSGSTGNPKGVCLSEQNLQRVSEVLADKIRDQSEQHLVLLPLSTLLENITGVYVPLLLGVTAKIYHGQSLGLHGSSRFEANVFASALIREKPNSLVLTPALLMALIQLVQQQAQLAESLRFVAVGGARVAPELIQLAHQLSIPAYEGYGLSECGSVVCINTEKSYKPGSCGQVLEHVEVKLADDGELLVKGNIALGYLGMAFTAPWLATGDLATIDDQGFVTLLGRKKNQLITSFGRNISPEWIESEAQSHFAGRPFIITGDAQAFLTAVTESQANINQRIQVLNQKLPDYAQIKRVIAIPSLYSHQEWFTANGRPKRMVLEQWVQEVLDTPSDALDHIQITEIN
ncbi:MULTISPECIES: AMP-binding protein [unclassified Agarivorans]|uniref:AMP-binding protein n=1 Tax=unclassified Agarivorans TaxID=2636026 RepID=UPI003D7CF629